MFNSLTYLNVLYILVAYHNHNNKRTKIYYKSCILSIERHQEHNFLMSIIMSVYITNVHFINNKENKVQNKTSLMILIKFHFNSSYV